VEVQLPPLCHPKYTSLQTQHEEGKALETFVQSVILKCVPLCPDHQSVSISCPNHTPTFTHPPTHPPHPRCGVVRREDLCIAEGRHVWRLNVDVHCLSHEGSLPDACALAAMAALSDVRLPGTVISKDDEVLIAPGTCAAGFQ
jgi:hypothetical protein